MKFARLCLLNSCQALLTAACVGLLSLSLGTLLSAGAAEAQGSAGKLNLALQQSLGKPSAVVTTEQVRAELMAQAPEGVRPGQTLWLGLQITHQPGWHTYWKNPGDSGLPTQLSWTLPEAFKASEIAWPAPRKLPLGNLANYGYEGTVLLPVPVTVPAGFAADELTVRLKASWLVCKKECIPQDGDFELSVPARASYAPQGRAFEAAWAAAPRELPKARGELRPGDAAEQVLHMRVDGLPVTLQGKTLAFFPETGGVTEPAAPLKQRWEGATWTAEAPLTPYRSEGPAQMPVVLTWPEAGTAQAGPGGPGAAWRLVLPVRGDWPAARAPVAVPAALEAALRQNAQSTKDRPGSAPPAPPLATSLSWLAALAGALLGGLILNLMPCVFPVLAIKVVAFAQHADDRRGHRINGLAYTAGVLVSFVALGALLLGLRAAGEQLGWGFQLQNPAVVAGLAVLFTLIGLNLAGLFEFGSVLPSSLASLQARRPAVDAFLTGVLATAIASPCTAPFMGASLGLAIALPTAQALAVFAALGLGMALPYLAASWLPAVARALPRPGAWMQTFRQLMAFPMFATVVWLLWVLGQQSGIDGVAALLMLLVAMALLVWTLGLKGRSGKVLAALSLAGLVWLGWTAGPQVTRLSEPSVATGETTATSGQSWQAWSPERQAELLAQGRPVFIDFTAAWCVTCQYNKRTTLANAEVLADMATKKVALLRADWTRRDPAVTAELAKLGRNGVPVYVLLKTGQPAQVLSEVLGVGEVRAALAGL